MATTKRKKPKAVTVSTLDALHQAAAVLFSKKTEELVLLDLHELSTLTDYYLIGTCQNEAQMRALMTAVQRALSKVGVKSLRSEYMSGVRWAVLDYGDFIIHLFEKKARGYYSLERLWGDAKSTHLKVEDYVLPEQDTDQDTDDDL